MREISPHTLVDYIIAKPNLVNNWKVIDIYTNKNEAQLIFDQVQLLYYNVLILLEYRNSLYTFPSAEILKFSDFTKLLPLWPSLIELEFICSFFFSENA
jgi:hypothetical protein